MNDTADTTAGRTHRPPNRQRQQYDRAYQAEKPGDPIEERRTSGMLPFVDSAEATITAPFWEARALEQQKARRRLLIRTTARAEHQQSGVALDPDRVLHMHRAGPPDTINNANDLRTTRTRDGGIRSPRPPSWPMNATFACCAQENQYRAGSRKGRQDRRRRLGYTLDKFVVDGHGGHGGHFGLSQACNFAPVLANSSARWLPSTSRTELTSTMSSKGWRDFIFWTEIASTPCSHHAYKPH